MTTTNIIQMDPYELKGRYEKFDVSVDKKKWKAFLAVFLGSVMERYDFALYGHMSALLSGYFFPTKDPALAMIQHFGVYALGFLTKPLGAYIFGSIGDKRGRKYALRWSILGIVVPTFLIGCLPSYAQWGLFSPLLLVLCRMAQGTFVSAENDGAEIFVFETISKRYSCLSSGIFRMSGLAGGTSASFIAGIIAQKYMPIWAWRVPFLTAALLGAGIVYFRRHLIESYDYIAYRNNNYKKSSQSFISALKKNKLSVAIAFFLTGSIGGSSYFYMVFWNHYLHKNLNLLTVEEACFRTSCLGIISMIAAPICGWLMDHLKIIPSIRWTAGFCMLMTVLNGIAIHSNKAPFALMAITVFGLIAFQIPSQILRLKLFPTGERYRCMSMGHAIAAMTLSSTAPVMGAYLWLQFKTPQAPLAYVFCLIFMGFVVTFFAKPRIEPRVPNYNVLPELTPEQTEAFIDSEPMIDVDTVSKTNKWSDHLKIHPVYKDSNFGDMDGIAGSTANIYQFSTKPKK